MEAKNTQWGKDSFFNKWCWGNWRKTCRTIKLDPYRIPLTKTNLKWIKNLNIRSDTIKLLRENVGKKLSDTGLGNNFLSMTPKAQTMKEKKSANGPTSN